jgi:hypothetical protein
MRTEIGQASENRMTFSVGPTGGTLAKRAEIILSLKYIPESERRLSTERHDQAGTAFAVCEV